MRVVVLVPRRADHGHRDRVWGWLAPKLPFNIYEGHHDDGPFNRSAAINVAAKDAGDWDVAIINDADCLVSMAQYRAAVELVPTGLTMAFDSYNRLSKHGTDWVLSGYFDNLASVVETTTDEGNSPCAVSREMWERVGGFDENFAGYGWEDNAFRVACEALAPTQRVPGPLFHLWHEPAGPPSEANYERYLDYLENA